MLNRLSLDPRTMRVWTRVYRVGLLLALLIGLASLLPIPRTAAQTADIVMDATAAYDGNFKYGEWLPIIVDLSNPSSDITGEVRVEVNSSQGTMVYSTPVTLPSGARKRVVVYVLPNNFSRELATQLVSAGKTVQTAKATVAPHPNISYFVGILAPNRGALSMLNAITFPGQDRPKTLVDLTIEDLPGRGEALQSFDLLIIDDIDTSKINPQQAAALTNWVEQGGHLVIGGGAGAQRTLSGLPAYLQPIHLDASIEVKSGALQPLALFANSEAVLTNGPFIAARGTPSAASTTRAGDVNLPIVQEMVRGSGAVDFVAFDLAGLPFNGWSGTTAFWEALTGPARAYPENMPFDMPARMMRASALSYPLSNIPSLDLPSITGLGILLGVYVLFIGPFNYLILRWQRKLHWAWFTIPILTLLFSGAAFGIGYTMRGNDLILNKVALIETKADGNAAVTSYMGLFSPRMQSYEMTVQGESLISPMNYDMGPWNASGQPITGGEMVFVQSEPSHVKGLTVNQFAMQSFMAEDNWSNFGTLSGDVRLENEALVGKVRNNTAYTLTDVVITLHTSYQRLGDMPPGTEKSVDMAMGKAQNDHFGTPISYRLFQEAYPNGPMPRAMEVKSNILSSVFDNNNKGSNGISSQRVLTAGSGAMQSGVIIFGWLDQAPPEVTVVNNTLTQRTTALVYSQISYTLPENGHLSLPPGFIPGSLTKAPNQGNTCGFPTSIYMGQGLGGTKNEAEFTFVLPPMFHPKDVTALKLSIFRDNPGVANAEFPTVAIYNVAQTAWVAMQDPIQGTNIIQQASPYVDANGQVKVRIAAQNDTNGCIYLDMGVEADHTPGSGG